jgi:RTX calcium-binding nonapeptide repeat (4 copies)
MRRLVMMLGVVMLGVLVAAGAAGAVDKICGNNLPCEGTDNNDTLFERIGNFKHDRIEGFDGRDVIDANTFDRDRDILRGDAGRDKLLTNDTDSNDVANGGRGRDTCYVSRGDAIRSCEVVHRATFGAGTSNVAQDAPKAAFGQ